VSGLPMLPQPNNFSRRLAGATATVQAAAAAAAAAAQPLSGAVFSLAILVGVSLYYRLIPLK
jgi:trimethylamine:corrinoid methyltransferase-like protein